MGSRYQRSRQNIVSYVGVGLLLLSVAIAGPGTHSVSAASCSTPLGTDVTSTKATVDSAYSQWKAKYVTSSGAGGDLRVQRSAVDNYDTVSEGIAYGMLFAAYTNDKPTFDGLWSYAKKHMNSNGVMNWRIAADGSTTGYNGATDADEDMAAALVAADANWGGYRSAALKQIAIIKQYEVEQGTYVLKPGDAWGGSSVLNPSYIAPSYYDLFQAYGGDSDWAKVKAANVGILQSAQNKSTGLVPDWSTSSGTMAAGMGHDFSYDASRAPLRQALSVTWSCDSAASDMLKPLNGWFAAKDLSQLSSSYTLDGTANGGGDATPTLAAVTAAASTSSDSTYRTKAWNALKAAPSTSYYPDSMRLFGLMVAGGVMVSPAELKQQPVVTSAPATLQITASDTQLSVGKQSELLLNVAAPREQSNMLVDVELYDKNGRKVAQQVYENQTLTTTSKSYALQWTPDTAGEYTLKGGIFNAGWSQNLLWNDKAASVTVAQPTAVQPSVAPAPIPTVVNASISIWWPGSTQAVTGTQPFKAVVDGRALADYDMYWQVDGGRLNDMDSVYDSAPHKESMVNLSGWNWSSTGKYTINFVAKTKAGATLAQKSVVITVAK